MSCTRFPDSELDEQSLLDDPAAQPNWPARQECDGQVFAQHLPEMSVWSEPDHAED